MKENSEEEKKGYFKPNVNYLPTNLDFDECLRDKKLIGFDNFNKDYCARIISKIYQAPVFNKSLRVEGNSSNRAYISLMSKIMYKENKQYRSYLDLLIECGILEFDNQYIIGEKSKGYRLTDNYYNQVPKRYLNYKFGKVCYGDRSVNISTDANYSVTTKKMIEFLPALKLDYKGSMDKLKNEYSKNTISTEKYKCAYCSLDKLNDGEFFALQDDYGRVHTNLTNLKKEYRNYLTADGEQLVSLDFKNSQPFFSTLLTKPAFWENKAEKGQLAFNSLNKNITNRIKNIKSIIMFTKSVKDNEDLHSYVNMVLDGSLYEFFLHALQKEGLKCQDRAEAKKSIFMVFFSKQAHVDNSKKAELFKSIFPSVNKLFELIKQNGHNLLAIVLQAIESSIVIEGIAGNFINKYKDAPIYTIHDSILISKKNINGVKDEIINYTVSRTGLKPSIEIEYLKV